MSSFQATLFLSGILFCILWYVWFLAVLCTCPHCWSCTCPLAVPGGLWWFLCPPVSVSLVVSGVRSPVCSGGLWRSLRWSLAWGDITGSSGNPVYCTERVAPSPTQSPENLSKIIMLEKTNAILQLYVK